jgi:hypothetical protein
MALTISADCGCSHAIAIGAPDCLRVKASRPQLDQSANSNR